MYWIDQNGNELSQGLLEKKSDTQQNSYATHAFRFRTAESRGHTVVFEYVGEASGTVDIHGCGEFGENETEELIGYEREQELVGLVHKRNAVCEGASAGWSCVRHVTEEELEAREKSKFGFQPTEGRSQGKFAHGRNAYQTIDNSYVSHIPKIIKLTQGSGLLKMSMTDNMKNILKTFWQDEKSKMTKHEVIPGAYANDNVVKMDKLDLDKYPGVRHQLVREMKDVLQWWTKRHLKHTSTFGVRIYRRDSMLINHVDRADTHLASAVLQLSQDSDEGWPLEVIGESGDVFEVYMQPFEMVLYEGARLFHGRPMRFNGTEFANIFSHFSPLGWNGPHKPYQDKLGPAQNMFPDLDTAPLQASSNHAEL